jgi:hypothetical protein
MQGPVRKANIHFKSSCPASANAPILHPNSGSPKNNSQRPITYSRRHAPNRRIRTGRSRQEAKEEGKRAGRNQDSAIRATTRLSTSSIASRNANKILRSPPRLDSGHIWEEIYWANWEEELETSSPGPGSTTYPAFADRSMKRQNLSGSMSFVQLRMGVQSPA